MFVFFEDPGTSLLAIVPYLGGSWRKNRIWPTSCWPKDWQTINIL